MINKHSFTKYIRLILTGIAFMAVNTVHGLPNSPETPSGQASDSVYSFVDEMPQYPGGAAEMMKFISHNLIYPETGLENTPGTRVVLRFVVTKEGTLREASIVKSISPEMDSAVLEVVNKMPQWIPGKLQGKSVDVYFTLPVALEFRKEAEAEVELVEPKPQFDKAALDSLDEKPQFPGGIAQLRAFLKNNLRYPKQAVKDKVQGDVFVCFVIGKDGSITNAAIAIGLSPETNAEALRVVKKMPKWIPGKKNGKPVRALSTLPIKYNLREQLMEGAKFVRRANGIK
ncbi:energy transducer TonB [Viscerimonas tarda]